MRPVFVLLCAWRDSNPHAVKHQILSLARLPITPHAHNSKFYSAGAKISNKCIEKEIHSIAKTIEIQPFDVFILFLDFEIITLWYDNNRS
jgi:hypothetical protein